MSVTSPVSFAKKGSTLTALDRARISSYGQYETGSVLRGAPSLNLRAQDTRTDANMLNNYHKRPIPTVAFTDVGMTDGALFQREGDLMLADTNGDMSLFTKIRNGNQSKIVTLGEDLYPNDGQHYQLDPGLPQVSENSLQKTYYPHLPISPTNKPIQPKPTLIDERMMAHTNDRDFAYGSDQEQLAINILRSPRRWEYINREETAERKLQGMKAPIDNWNENALSYSTKQELPTIYTVEDVKKEARQLNPLDDIQLERNLQQMGKFRELTSDSVRKQTLVQRNEWEHYPSWENNRRHADQKKPSLIESITSTIMKFFGKDQLKQPESLRNQDDFIENFNNENLSMNIEQEGVSPYQINRENLQHTFLVRDGEIMTMLPETLETYGSVYVSPTDRLMVMMENGQLHLIHKTREDAIFQGDLRRLDKDYLVTVIPEHVQADLRQKLKMSEGRKFVELPSEEFIELIDMIHKYPEMQTRVHPEQIMSKLKDFSIDQDMLTNFSGRNQIITNEAIIPYMQELREKNMSYKEKPILEDHDQIDSYDGLKQVPVLRGQMKHTERYINQGDYSELIQSIPEYGEKQTLTKPILDIANHRQTDFSRFRLE